MGKRGFSLIELSIVLVVIGLLAGAVISSNALIQQSELRTLASEFNELTTAYNNFKGTYGSPPGDIPSYSGFASDPALITTDIDQRPYGNGDGMIVSRVNWGYGTDETRLAMKHLSVAGMISYPIGLVVPSDNIIPGISAPASKIDDTIGYMFLSYAIGEQLLPGAAKLNEAGNMDDIFTDNPELGGAFNVLYLGAKSQTMHEVLLAPSMTPSMAYALDVKIDDAAIISGNYYGSSSGKFRALNGEAVTGCVKPSTSGTVYDMTLGDSILCLVGIKMD